MSLSPSNVTLPDGIDAFLASAGWTGCAIEPLAGDASFRRYFRVRRGEASAMLMDAPPPNEDPQPFLRAAKWLDANGMRAPRILAEDTGRGLVLLEDFGLARMRDYLDQWQDDEREVYRAAVDALVDLHRLPPGPFLDYGMAEYQREVKLLTEWYCPAQNLSVDAPGYAEAWEQVLKPLLPRQRPGVTVLRDYHAENIMLLGELHKQGLLDFQDALIGHRAYDLVSLLQDARRDVSPELEAEMFDHYLQTSGVPGEEFLADYARLGAQRNAKIVGIFVRLWKRDGKPRYLDLIPRVWALMERDLMHPALEPVARWFDANIPAELRETGGGELRPVSDLVSDTAMVMAAGLGKRMRPLTASQPKPLVRVNGKALIDYSLDGLVQAGVAKAVVNVHYLADALEAHLTARKKGPAITISDERDLLLETGGAMVKAAPLLPDPFFCLNSDNIWLDGPQNVFRELSARWDPEQMDALLLVAPHARAFNYEGKGDFHLDPLGRVSRRRTGRIAPFIYTGIQIVSHRLLRNAPEGPFSTNVLWERAIAEDRLYGLSHTGLWCEVGDPAAIAPTEALSTRA